MLDIRELRLAVVNNWMRVEVDDLEAVLAENRNAREVTLDSLELAAGDGK